MSNKLVKIPGRVLTQETLQGNGTKFPAGNEADWTSSLRAAPMFTCAEIKRWAVLGPQSNGGQVRQFVKTLLTVAKKMSFNLPPPEMLVLVIYYLKHLITYSITKHTMF